MTLGAIIITYGEAAILLGLTAAFIMVAIVFVKNEREREEQDMLLSSPQLDRLERDRGRAIEREKDARDRRVRLEADSRREADRLRARAADLDPADGELDLRDRIEFDLREDADVDQPVEASRWH